jgi:hypothetical protein
MTGESLKSPLSFFSCGTLFSLVVLLVDVAVEPLALVEQAVRPVESKVAGHDEDRHILAGGGPTHNHTVT